MVALRLQRIGKKKQPHFRLIAQEKTKDPWDKSLEILGWINPRTKEKKIKKERVEYWLSVGAQPTDTVHNLLVNEGILKAEKVKTFKISKKRKEKKEGNGEAEGAKDEKAEKQKEETKESDLKKAEAEEKETKNKEEEKAEKEQEKEKNE